MATDILIPIFGISFPQTGIENIKARTAKGILARAEEIGVKAVVVTRSPHKFHNVKTSRINVAHFMAGLIMNDDKWYKWKGQMPVIYNKSSSS